MSFIIDAITVWDPCYCEPKMIRRFKRRDWVLLCSSDALNGSRAKLNPIHFFETMFDLYWGYNNHESLSCLMADTIYRFKLDELENPALTEAIIQHLEHGEPAYIPASWLYRILVHFPEETPYAVGLDDQGFAKIPATYLAINSMERFLRNNPHMRIVLAPHEAGEPQYVWIVDSEKFRVEVHPPEFKHEFIAA